MRRSNVRSSVIAISLFGIALLTSVRPAASQTASPTTASSTTAPADTVADLRRQRIETLRAVQQQAHAMFEHGQLVSAEEMNRYDNELLDAELEAASGTAERIQLLTTAVQEAKQQEQVTLALYHSGVVTNIAALQAKAARLQREIALAQAQAAEH